MGTKDARPDYVFDPENWECAHQWRDRSELVEDDIDLDDGPKMFWTLNKGADKWAVRCGDFGTVEWFDSFDEANTAMLKARAAEGEE